METMRKLKYCPICHENIKPQDLTTQGTYYVPCLRCGNYRIDEDTLKMTLKQRSVALFYLTQKNSNKTLIPWIHNDSDEEKTMTEDGKFKLIYLDGLFHLYPKTLSERIDMVLLNLSTRLKYVGDTVYLLETSFQEKLYIDFFIDDNYDHSKQYRGMLSTLIELNYIKELREGFYTLTAYGWDKINQLQTTNTQLHQVFVAMWFDPTMDEIKKTFKGCIEACGYSVLIISYKEHNNQIVPEIFYEIKQSEFLVADLTGNRGGVYYEAGFAEGLGKEVILTCRESDFNNRHFDVAQKNTIRWVDEHDLSKQLYERIRATIGLRSNL